MEFTPHQQPEEETATAVPSLETLRTVAGFLPPAGIKFDLVEKAEDFEETPERFQTILNCLQMMGAIDYDQKDGEITLARIEIAGNVTDAAYFRIFINPRTREIISARFASDQEDKSA